MLNSSLNLYGYPKISQCRVCSKVDEDIRMQIDEQLMTNTMSYAQIVVKFAPNFSNAHPLTEVSLKNHRKHLYEHLAALKLNFVERKPNGQLVLKDSTEIAEASFMERVAIDLAEGLVNTDQLLTACILDHVKDMDRINEILENEKLSVYKERPFIETKNKVREGLVNTIGKKKELEELTGAELDKKRITQDVAERFIRIILKSFKELHLGPEQVKRFGNLLSQHVAKDALLSKYITPSEPAPSTAVAVVETS